MTLIELLKENYMALLSAMGNTLKITALSLVFASIIGVFIGLLNVSKKRWMNIIARIYIDAVRGVPLIVLAYFIYFGAPQSLKAMGILPKSTIVTATIAGVITLSLNAGAYMAEIVRGGIEAIDKGQMEAARSLGMPYGKAMSKVVLPQAIRVMIPSFINQFIITLKDTSILSVIGLEEMTKAGNIITARSFEISKTWLIVAAMYLIVITILSRIAQKLERRISYGK